ncbi:MAG TPA: hypothetical protein VF901_12655 [Bradyrhizobium sp.]
MTFGEEAADAAVDKRAPGWIGDIAQRVRPIFGVVREPRIGGDADIAGGEIGEQRILAGSAVAVAVVAFRLAPEEVIADLLLGNELRLVGEHGVELGGEGSHLGGGS